jgi:histidine triad (HIT) family protein
MPAAPDDDCTFCAIVAGKLPAHVVLDDGVAMAFLDVRPLFPGHTLVVPREHHVTLTDLPPDQVEPLFARVRRVTRAVERGMAAAGSFVALNNVVSQSVPHLHVHVVPRNRKDGLRGFFWPRTRYGSDDEAAGVASTLRAALAEVDAEAADTAGTADTAATGAAGTGTAGAG